MNALQFQALLPFIVLGAASIVVILLIAFGRSHTFIQVTGFLMMCLVVLAMWYVKDSLPRDIPPLLVVDGLGALFTGLIVFSILVVGLLSFIYFEEREENPKEYYILLFLATMGAAVMTISRHFVSLFIGLEMLSVSLYALIAYLRTRNNAVEAGTKYLVLAALSSAFLLFGMALIYMETGSMEFTGIAHGMSSAESPVLFVLGIGFLVVAIGFKLALAPFHLWAADVYQGAPAPVTVFIATVSKVGVFAALLRFAQAVHLKDYPTAISIFSTIAMASMLVGNLLALRQQNLKRLLAYSSIAHFGYLLVAFLPGDAAGTEAGFFYLVVYSISLLSAFGIITLLSTRQEDAGDLDLYKGLFWKQPLMGAVLTIAMLSLAGIPLTGGFLGKFFVIGAGIKGQLWPPVIMLVVTSVIGLYYYLRVISVLFERVSPQDKGARPLHPFFYYATYSVLILLMCLSFWLGLFPRLAISGIEELLKIRLL